jgi:hypothetical protein
MDEAQVVTPEEERPKVGPDAKPDNGQYQPLVDHCMKLFNQFEKSEYRKSKIAEIEDSRRTYEQIEDPKNSDFPFDNASNMTMPLNTITVDNLEPRIVAGLVGTKPTVRMEMEGMTEQDQPTELVQSWFNQELESRLDIETETMGLTHLALLEGTVYYLPKYDLKKVMKRDFVFDQAGNLIPNPQTGEPLTEDKMVPVYEGGTLENIPFTDVYCADNLGTPEDWERADKVRVTNPTYGELMRSRESVGWMADKIGPWLLSNKGSGEITTEAQTPGQSVVGVKYSGRETIPCLEFEVTYQMFKDEEAPPEEQENFEEDKIIAVIHKDTKTLIRLCYLRELNFNNESIIKRVRMFPEKNRSFGTSIYGKIKSIQNGCTDYFNTILNVSFITMLPWFFYDESSGVRKDIEIKPGKGVPVDNVKGILFPNFNNNPISYLPFIEMFIQLWERIGSVANPQVGRPSDSAKTATEIMMVVQEGNIKFDYQARTTKQEFLAILKTLYDLYYMHMPYNKTFVYNGEEVPLPRKLMKRNYKFKLMGSTAMANKMLVRKEAEDMLGMAMNMPHLNVIAALEDVLKSRDKTDLNKWINPEARALVEALKEHPEIPQVVAGYLKTKMETEEAVIPAEERKMFIKPKVQPGPAMPGALNSSVMTPPGA